MRTPAADKATPVTMIPHDCPDPAPHGPHPYRVRRVWARCAGVKGLELATSTILSHRQWTLLCHVADGLTNGQIGKKMHTTEDGTKTAMRVLLTRLGAPNGRAQAVHRGYALGLLPVPPDGSLPPGVGKPEH